MVARAGANLRHIAPTHPGCSALRIANAPASPLSPPQTSRQAEAALRAGEYRGTSPLAKRTPEDLGAGEELGGTEKFASARSRVFLRGRHRGGFGYRWDFGGGGGA
jgi:hypothetical protein